MKVEKVEFTTMSKIEYKKDLSNKNSLIMIKNPSYLSTGTNYKAKDFVQ